MRPSRYACSLSIALASVGVISPSSALAQGAADAAPAPSVPESTPPSNLPFTPSTSDAGTPEPPGSAAPRLAPLAPPHQVSPPAVPGPSASALPIAPPATPVAQPSTFSAAPAAARSRPVALDSARIANAHADRVVLLPTAYTHPSGTFYLSSYDIVLLQAGYAFDDTTQLTFTGVPPLTEDVIIPVDLSLKTALIRASSVRVAAIGSISGLFGLEEGGALLGRVGGVTELCFDDSCESSASIGTTLVLAGPAMIVANGAGVIWRVASFAALMLEVDTLMPIGREAGEIHAIAVAPAVRFPFRNWALDLGFVRPLDSAGPVEVLPLVVFSYRFLP